jgi:hypothetical protein
MWVYITVNPADYAYIYGQGPNSTASMSLYIQSGKFNIWNGSNIIAGATTYLLNTWYHVAISRSSTSLRLFLNGIQDGSVTNSSNITTGSTLGASIGRWAEIGDTRYFTGYISNVRVLKGTALYTANFTPPTSPLTAIANTSLLTLQSRIGENNHRFVDQSSLNHLITRSGNATQGSFSPFSQTGWSNYFDGTSDSLLTPGDTSLVLDGNFTIEFFMYLNSLSLSAPISSNQGSFTSGAFAAIISHATASNKLSIWVENINNAAFLIASTSTLSIAQWYHVAIVRNSGVIRLYLNGVDEGNTSSSATITLNGGSTPRFRIGQYWNGTINGYISNLRVLKGSAVYTSAFTPPTSPLTAIANTSLLTCQSNQLIDNSTNNFTITKNGDVSVQAFSPFAPTTEYLPATHGGSGYFDGTGDYLSIPNNSALKLTNGDWTIEFWMYCTGAQASSNNAIWTQDDTGGFTGIIITANSSRQVQFTSSQAGNAWTYLFQTFGTYTDNTWHHVAVTKSGSTVRGFFNGVLGLTINGFPATVFSSANASVLGVYASSAYFNGYISNFRIVKGTAVYTSNFTPPTAPVTATANTSLLLNFTNAGIVDATAKNTFETVGAARVSTALSKFGGSSLYFDGSGDYLKTPASQNFIFGSGNWTIELWVYLNATSRQGFAAFGDGAGSIVPWEIGVGSAGKFRLLVQPVSASQIVIDGTTTPTTGTWYHIAGVRNGSTATLYVNGISEASSSALSTTALNTVADAVVIGSYSYGFELNGYIDDLRITKGFARYTANFTPPTATFKLR